MRCLALLGCGKQTLQMLVKRFLTLCNQLSGRLVTGRTEVLRFIQKALPYLYFFSDNNPVLLFSRRRKESKESVR